jgi:hypothetical protein
LRKAFLEHGGIVMANRELIVVVVPVREPVLAR